MTYTVIIVRETRELAVLLRKNIVIVNWTHGTHSKTSIYLFLLTLCGPIYCSPP